MGILWVRDEVKPGEKRAPLSPSDAAMLVQNGHTVYVESSNNRIFKDQKYRQYGCAIVPQGTWPSAPKEALILGLKYLPDQHEALVHQHCYFSHAYNTQRLFTEKPGVPHLLQSFRKGGGTLYDIEFLLDFQKKRIAAFGFFAGFAGTAIGLILGEQKFRGCLEFKIPSSFSSQEQMIETLSKSLDCMRNKSSLIVGSQGRCAQGVKKLLDILDMPYTEWSRKETSTPCLLKTITDYDVVYNCTYAKERSAPFLTKNCLTPSQKLSFLVDISCETSQNTFFPLCPKPTTFKNPIHRIPVGNFNFDILAIDNLPNALPLESSLEFSAQMLPHLNDILSNRVTHPWETAENIFRSHISLDNAVAL